MGLTVPFSAGTCARGLWRRPLLLETKLPPLGGEWEPPDGSPDLGWGLLLQGLCRTGSGAKLEEVAPPQVPRTLRNHAGPNKGPSLVGEFTDLLSPLRDSQANTRVHCLPASPLSRPVCLLPHMMRNGIIEAPDRPTVSLPQHSRHPGGAPRAGRASTRVVPAAVSRGAVSPGAPADPGSFPAAFAHVVVALET